MSASIALSSPFHNLKTSTDRAVKRGVKTAATVKKVQSAIAPLCFLQAVPRLLFLSYMMKKGIAVFNSPAADSLDMDQLRILGHDLSQIVGRLRRLDKIYKESEIRNSFPYRSILDKIVSRTDHLSAIVDGINMSLDSSFGDAIALAAEELRSATDTAERRVLVGHM